MQLLQYADGKKLYEGPATLYWPGKARGSIARFIHGSNASYPVGLNGGGGSHGLRAAEKDVRGCNWGTCGGLGSVPAKWP